MAVLPEYQRQGIGQALVEHLEADVRRGMTKTVFLHARHYAVSFYQGCGYRITGAPFQEVGLEHVRMSKALESIL